MKNISKVMCAMSALFAFSNIYTGDTLAGKKRGRSVKGGKRVTISQAERDLVSREKLLLAAYCDGLEADMHELVADLEAANNDCLRLKLKVADLTMEVAALKAYALDCAKKNHELSVDNSILTRDLDAAAKAGVRIVYERELACASKGLKEIR